MKYQHCKFQSQQGEYDSPGFLFFEFFYQWRNFAFLRESCFKKTHLIVDPVGGAQISKSVLRQKLLSFETDPLGGAAGENFYTGFGHVGALYVFAIFRKKHYHFT